MATRTILSIDGGGIRGIVPAKVLQVVEERTGQRVADLFDYVAGTSTGGILALGLTKPNATKDGSEYPAARLIDLYEKNGSTIFSRSLWHTVEAVGNLSGPKYQADGIEGVMKAYFGPARLGDARTSVLVTAYDIERRSPFLFKSWRAQKDPKYDFPMWQVARATSAAPTYFPPAYVASGDDHYGLIDGGVYANNPGLCVYADALTENRAIDDFVFLSLGTGNLDRRIRYEQAVGWGLAAWVHPLLDVLSDGVSDTVDYQLRELLAPRIGRRQYFRIQSNIPDAKQELDDTRPETIQTLKVVADRLVEEHSESIDELCHRLIDVQSSRAARTA